MPVQIFASVFSATSTEENLNCLWAERERFIYIAITQSGALWIISSGLSVLNFSEYKLLDGGSQNPSSLYRNKSGYSHGPGIVSTTPADQNWPRPVDQPEHLHKDKDAVKPIRTSSGHLWLFMQNVGNTKPPGSWLMVETHQLFSGPIHCGFLPHIMSSLYCKENESQAFPGVWKWRVVTGVRDNDCIHWQHFRSRCRPAPPQAGLQRRLMAAT